MNPNVRNELEIESILEFTERKQLRWRGSKNTNEKEERKTKTDMLKSDEIIQKENVRTEAKILTNKIVHN